MRPLAQTFIINESSSGAEAVFLLGIDLFFRSKPSLTSFGVEVQIRETLAGIPLSKQMPYASKLLSANDIQISSDATVATRFTFNTPVMIRTNELFAIAVLPLGGSSEFRIWTAQRDAIDVATGSQVVFPNSVGNLYAPSNDLSDTVIQNQCLKFNLITANFTAFSGTAVYKQGYSEFFRSRPPIGIFADGERVVISNNNLKLAALTVSPGSPFTIGEIVVQPNTATNTASATAHGTVYLSNSTVTLLKDTSGKFSISGGGLNGLSSSIKTVNPSAAHTNTLITSACNIITVPTTTTPDSDFANGNFIYIGKSTLANTQVARITAVNPATRQLTLDRVANVSEDDASYGRVKSDGSLYGFLSFVDINDNRSSAIVSIFNSTANATQNFTSSNGLILIGTDTGATAQVNTLTDIFYNSITSQISSIDSKDTVVNFSFSGFGNNNAADAEFTNVFSDIPYEFVDRQRVIFSKSNELVTLSGSKSLTISTYLQSFNTKFSPYLDNIRSNAILSSNQIRQESELDGFYLNIENSNGALTGTVLQSNATSNTSGVISFANDSFVVVTNVVSTNTAQIATFTANSTSIITSGTGVVANVTAVSRFNEALGNGSPSVPRYISKTVVLAESQDSEDMVVFLSAYRPQDTDIKVFAKLLNATDSDPFDDKSWTPMIDTTPFLISSLANRDDYVELKFELPQNVLVHTSNISVNTTSSVITFTNSRTTEEFNPGMFVYVADNATQTFAVRRVLSVPNTTALVVASNLTFDSSNSAIGYISESLAQCNAFRYNENNGIVRYVCSSTDSIFDGYKTFAIKIVLTSNSTQIVPRIADMRTLALQI
jgi:hypothetical protein